MAEQKKRMHDLKLKGSAECLEEGGKGFRFYIKDNEGEVIPAFVIKYDYQFFAYKNKCGHIAVQLDYMPGDFFNDDGNTLMCATHGAEYAPDTGACLGGPCYGVGLEKLDIIEQEGRLFLKSDQFDVVDNDIND